MNKRLCYSFTLGRLPMTTGQIISVLFLVAMIVLILRGIRGNPRRPSEGVELDATGREVGSGAMRMYERVETETFGGAEGGGAGD
jgi:hypothetical protein